MNDEISVENLTLKQIINCLSMIKKLKQENILKFDINTTEATINYDAAINYLEEQNVEQAKVISKLNKQVKYLANKYNADIEEYNNRLNDVVKERNKYMHTARKFEDYLIDRFNTTQDTRYCDDLIKLRELNGVGRQV